jgi:hypothetical protein
MEHEALPAIVPVRVVPDPTPTAVVVVSPLSLRIEGLSLADAVRVSSGPTLHCAGAICRFSDEQDRGVEKVWLP